MMKFFLPFSVLLLCSVSLHAQLRNSDVYELPHVNQSNVRRNIAIPNIPGYMTLKGDFHIHTVFSDGKVWPDVRVREAWKDGLDVIAITDHIEYRPHKKVVLGDLNESYKIAKKSADNWGIIAIQGTEITRQKPLGHLNALFINDANVMDIEDPLKAIDLAIEQGAFIMWNHPGWPDDKSTVYDVHKKLIEQNKLHGVEIVNHMEYYPSIITLCRDKKLTFFANSDAHETIYNDYGSFLASRPITLVFAEQRTPESIKEAMFAGRTVALFDHTYFGKADLLEQLVKASVGINVVNEQEKTALVELTNNSDVVLRIKINKQYPITLLPHRTVRTTIAKKGVVSVLNCYIAEGENLQVNYPY